MKFLVLFACAIAVASAHVIPVHYVHHAALPVVDTNGVPQDTLEVQHAKAAHYAAKAEAHLRNGDYYYATHPVYYAAYAAPVAASTQWTGEQHVPVINENGVPEDTAEVKAARAEHLARKAEAEASAGHEDSAAVETTSSWSGEQHVPVINENGVPEDTAEVKAARAEHLAIKAEAEATEEDAPSPTVETTSFGWSGPVHTPVINENGVPEDTAEVKAARAEHLAAKAEAEQSEQTWSGEQHVPVLTANGVPEDTDEVKQARAEHLAAVAEADATTVAPEAAPVADTEEVAAAKAQHFAAHAEARATHVAHATYYATPYVAAPYVHHYGRYYGNYAYTPSVYYY